MRILFVGSYYKPAYAYGGPVNSSGSLCQGLIRAGAQVTVFTTNANKGSVLDVPIREPVIVDDVTVWYFPLLLNGLTYFFSPSQARATFMHVNEYDITVAGALWGLSLITTAISSLHYHIPYVVPIRGQLNPWAMATKGLKKRIYLNLVARYFVNHAAAVYCTDPSERESVAKLNFRSPTFVIPNGIQASSFINQQHFGFFRSKFGIQDNAIVLLFLGRLTHIKRPDIAVDTLHAAQTTGQDVHLILAGPDEDGLAPELKALALRLDCGDRLHFTGLLDRKEVVSVLTESNLLIMPSEVQENFGNAALEALAVGVPILVSEGIPVGWWAEKVDAGQAVPCTTGDFQRAAIELLRNPEHLKDMGHRGQLLVSKYFDSDVIAERMLAQFQSIIDTGHPLPDSSFDQEFIV